MRKTASHLLGVSEVVSELASRMKGDDEKQEMRRRRVFERFMASCVPGSPYLFLDDKKRAGPCVLYTMMVSIKKAQAFWSHRSSRRFFPERRGSYPIPICRAAGADDHVEPVVDQSGAPGEPSRPCVVSGNFEERYYYIELYREKDGVLHKDGSPAPWREVAVIRGMPGGRGVTVTSHVKRLVLRLHDTLFMLCGISATVDLRFSEKWFRLPAGWTEERLYAEDGSPIVDIGSSVESLVKKLCDLREEEEQEMERQSMETEEERDRRLQEEEARRLQEEEEMRKIRERNEEKERKRREEQTAMRPVHPPTHWDPTLWSINEAHPTVVHWYSKFRLSMDSNMKVSCDCVGKESLKDMLRRVDNVEYILPITKASSSSALETLGFVEESDHGLEILGFGPKKDRLIDRSGRTMSSVVMVSRSMEKVLIVRVRVGKLDIVMDDGMIMSCRSGFAVDIHCDDISSSELLTMDWAYHILCKNIDGEGRTSVSTLLAHLKKKLQLQLTEQELELYNMSIIDDEEENEDLMEPLRKLKEWIPPEPKPELPDVELHDCIFFQIPWESEI